MKLIIGLEYRSKIRRNASWSPWHARATRSAELFIRDPANAPGCPSRLNSWASRFIVFRCVSEPPRPKVSNFSTPSSTKISLKGDYQPFQVDRIVSKKQFGNTNIWLDSVWLDGEDKRRCVTGLAVYARCKQR